jgi:hypothetical protein
VHFDREPGPRELDRRDEAVRARADHDGAGRARPRSGAAARECSGSRQPLPPGAFGPSPPVLTLLRKV